MRGKKSHFLLKGKGGFTNIQLADEKQKPPGG